MMTVRARIARMLVGWALWGRHQPPTDVGRLRLRCVWTDCDVNLHMNNSRYLALMDLGRWHYVLATGLFGALRRRRWYPVAVRVEIDFKKSIQPGDRFELETRAVSATERSVTIQQRFWRGEDLCADAKVVVLFLERGKPQALEPLFLEVPVAAPSRPESALDGEVHEREAAHVGQ